MPDRDKPTNADEGPGRGDGTAATPTPDPGSTDDHVALVAAALVGAGKPMTAGEVGLALLGRRNDAFVERVVAPALRRLSADDRAHAAPGTARYVATTRFAQAVATTEEAKSSEGLRLLEGLRATFEAYPARRAAPPTTPTVEQGIDTGREVPQAGVDPTPTIPTHPEPTPGNTMSNQHAPELVEAPATRPTPRAAVDGSRMLRADESAEIEATVASVKASLQALRDRKARESRARIEAEVLRQVDAQIQELLAEGVPMEEIQAALAEGGFSPAGA